MIEPAVTHHSSLTWHPVAVAAASKQLATLALKSLREFTLEALIQYSTDVDIGMIFGRSPPLTIFP